MNNTELDFSLMKYPKIGNRALRVSHSQRKELYAALGHFPGMTWFLYLSVSAVPNPAFLC